VFAPRIGCYVDALHRWSYCDTMTTTGRVAAILRTRGGRAVVDVIGLGAGVVDRLRELGLRVEPFNSSEGSEATDRSGELHFLNRRAAAWWSLRESLEPSFSPAIGLPPDDELIGDLTAPRWRINSSGKIQIESKDEIRKRLGRSTDAGDAVVQILSYTPKAPRSGHGYTSVQKRRGFWRHARVWNRGR
jgi:hypothetical protein